MPDAYPPTEVNVRGAWARVRAPGLEDDVAVEEPLEIRVDGRPLAVTMRTPGHDEELALGFLFGEGLIDEARAAGPPADLAANTVEVAGPLLREPDARSFFTSSSCGVCGKGALEQVAVHAPAVAPGGVRIARALLAALPDRLRQPGFARTGGLHATGLFTEAGELLVAREDVGRHNAMDKVVGHALRAQAVPLSHERPLRVRTAVVRARAEGGGRGGPGARRRGGADSLAVRLAADRGLTLAGFARNGRVNVYSGTERGHVTTRDRRRQRTPAGSGSSRAGLASGVSPGDSSSRA